MSNLWHVLGCYHFIWIQMHIDQHVSGKTCGTSKLQRRKTGISPVFIAFYDLPRVFNSWKNAWFQRSSASLSLSCKASYQVFFGHPAKSWEKFWWCPDFLNHQPMKSIQNVWSLGAASTVQSSPNFSVMKSRHLDQVVNPWIHANQLDHHSMFMSFDHLISFTLKYTICSVDINNVMSFPCIFWAHFPMFMMSFFHPNMARPDMARSPAALPRIQRAPRLADEKSGTMTSGCIIIGYPLVN